MEVYYWQNESGRMPVYEFVTEQSPDARQRIMKTVEYLADRGLKLMISPSRMKQFKGYKNLYELKIDWRGIFYRIIFCVVNGAAHLLVAFKKKDNRTTERYIKTALNRQRALLAAAINF